MTLTRINEFALLVIKDRPTFLFEAKLLIETVCPEVTQSLTHSLRGVTVFLFWPITQQSRFT